MQKRIIITSIILAAITGIAAGVFSSILTIRFAASLPLLKGVRIGSEDTSGEIVIRDPRKVIVEEDVQLGTVSEKLRLSTARFFPFRKAGETPLANAFLPAEYITQGPVITSDGWVAVSNGDGIRPGAAVGLVGNDLYAVERIVHDPLSDITFVKLQASGLQVVAYANRSLIRSGQRVLAMAGYSGAVTLRSIANVYAPHSADRQGFVRSSEGINTAITIDGVLTAALNGSPVLTTDGELAGVITDATRGMVLPASYIAAAGDAIIRTGTVTLPYLGVHYINTAQTPGALRSDVRGAYIIGGTGVSAVSVTSPLSGKVATGDIITAVEGQSIDEYRDLQDLIRTYRPGSEITISVTSKGQQRNIQLILSEK